MKRILEPEFMDCIDEAEEYAALDHSEPNRDVVACLLAAGGDRGRVIDLGTGPGDIPILIARAAPDARITAVDAAETMLTLARRRITTAGLADRIELVKADVKELPFPDDDFDAVFSNTILHHIPEPVVFLREAARIRRPDGALVIRDLCRPSTRGDAEALVAKHAGTATVKQQMLLFDSLCAALTLDEARRCAADAGLGAATVEMSSDRHWTILIARS